MGWAGMRASAGCRIGSVTRGEAGRAIRGQKMRPYLVVGAAAIFGFLLADTPAASSGCGGGTSIKPEGLRYPYLAEIEGTGLACVPATIGAEECRWTFLVRGDDAYRIDGARLELGDRSYEPYELVHPTPHGAVLHFEYDPVEEGARAQLVLYSGSERIGAVRIEVTPTYQYPKSRRQQGRVRLRLLEGTVFYPRIKGRDAVKGRSLDEIEAVPEFRSLLEDLGITRIRKVLADYAEHDTTRWDSRFARWNPYSIDRIREYLVEFDKSLSEEAYRRIFEQAPGVKDAFVNKNR